VHVVVAVHLSVGRLSHAHSAFLPPFLLLLEVAGHGVEQAVAPDGARVGVVVLGFLVGGPGLRVDIVTDDIPGAAPADDEEGVPAVRLPVHRRHGHPVAQHAHDGYSGWHGDTVPRSCSGIERSDAGVAPGRRQEIEGAPHRSPLRGAAAGGSSRAPSWCFHHGVLQADRRAWGWSGRDGLWRGRERWRRCWGCGGRRRGWGYGGWGRRRGWRWSRGWGWRSWNAWGDSSRCNQAFRGSRERAIDSGITTCRPRFAFMIKSRIKPRISRSFWIGENSINTFLCRLELPFVQNGCCVVV
jgi:hypothetical protein